MKHKRRNPPALAAWLLKQFFPKYDQLYLAEDFEEIYRNILQEKGFITAWFWSWGQVFISIPRFIFSSIYWRFAMFKNYMKIALRNMLKYKMYSFINIMGLAIGLSCCLLIAVCISFKLSFDNYHKDSDRIYRIGYNTISNSGTQAHLDISYLLAPFLKEKFPQIEKAANIMQHRRFDDFLIRKDGKVFYANNFVKADNEIFDILSIQFIRGNPENALINPGTIVISERMSEKYFGNVDPIGETINVNSNDVIVTGVMANAPVNTIFNYDFIASLKGNEIPDWARSWDIYDAAAYVKFKQNSDLNHTLRQIDIKVNKVKPHKGGERYSYFLIAIKDIHLYFSNKTYLYVFPVIAVLILFIACFNFINLSISSSATRAKEVGIRKVVGAFRKQLIYQFIGESLLITIFAAVTALFIAGMLLSFINNIMNVQFSFSDLVSLKLFMFLLFMIVLTGIIAGCYPAFFLSAFKPVTILKGKFISSKSGGGLRKIMVIGQFAVSIILIIGTIIIYEQFHYMRNTNLGFNKEQKLIIPTTEEANISGIYESLKNEFLNHTQILGASVSYTVPGRMNNWGRVKLLGEVEDKSWQMRFLSIDEDFIENYNIKIVAGEQFIKEMSLDKEKTFIINEAAVRAFGWNSTSNAIGKRMNIWGKDGEIIGVVKDFHVTGLQSEIDPLVINIYPELFKMITLSISAENINETLSFVEDKWKELLPGIPFEYFFLDTDFDRYYRTEEIIGKMLGAFTFIGLSIACLGLFGLAAFTVQQRTKEVGIRKVLGASVESIVLLLGKEFIKWIIIANLIAFPIAYFVMNKWLQNYAYRVSLGIWTFILSGMIALITALITVSYQAFKVANTNPVNSLKYE